MNARFLPILVALSLGAFPALAAAQTSDYDTVPPLETSTSTTPTPTTTAEPEPTPTEEAEPTTATSTPTATTPAATAAAPTTLAYTGSEVWLVGLIGFFALVGGAALLRPTRRA